MREHLLFMIWSQRLYQAQGLCTTSGQAINVIHPGYLNAHSGPDFSEASLEIGGIRWHGNIEIHTKTSDWIKHGHCEDPSYQHIILHVVYQNDLTVDSIEEAQIPTLELGPHIPNAIKDNARLLLQSKELPLCSKHLKEITRITKLDTLEKSFVKKLERKCQHILERVEQLKGDWHQTAYELCCRSLGFGLNGSGLELLAKKTPYKIIRKNIHDKTRLTALLFGQSALLNAVDDYSKCLNKEYNFLQAKYSLSPVKEGVLKFAKTRPYNFPTIRVAQLCAILYASKNIISFFEEVVELKEWMNISINADDYWKKHTNFGKTTLVNYSELSVRSRELLYINFLGPMQFSYGKKLGKPLLVENVLYNFEQLKPENNHIIRKLKSNSFPVENAIHSQGALQLYTVNCTNKRCATCPIGQAIIRSDTAP